MFGMNQGPMTSMQIMDILNQNQMMKIMTYTIYINSKSNDDESNDKYIKFVGL